jgi:hypothetical protein
MKEKEEIDIMPETLYKYRGMRGIAAYKRIEGNIYEDTTCKHEGDHCRVSVKRVGDHWELGALINESAKEYECFHTTGDLDSQFHETKNAAFRDMISKRIRKHEVYLKQHESELSKMESELASMSEIKERPHDISALNFGDSVVFPVGTVCSKTTIELKVFGKDGLAYLLTSEGYKVLNGSDGRSLLLIEDIYNEDGYRMDSRESRAFFSKDDLDAFNNNEHYRKVKEAVNRFIPQKIEQTKADIQKFKNELKKYEE